ncbi:unnamed protein product, partial [Amoebophrya sp. A25]|eukprot:GSA25T00003736001.1
MSSSSSTSFFFDPATASDGQLFFLTAVYGYVLYQASELISSGSELLLLVPSLAGVVGTVVLPVLAAVPDGLMILFSGLVSTDNRSGDDHAGLSSSSSRSSRTRADQTLDVGVGTLAGSTIMLLTIPWFLSILGGRVPLSHCARTGELGRKDENYTSHANAARLAEHQSTKKTIKEARGGVRTDVEDVDKINGDNEQDHDIKEDATATRLKEDEHPQVELTPSKRSCNSNPVGSALNGAEQTQEGEVGVFWPRSAVDKMPSNTKSTSSTLSVPLLDKLPAAYGEEQQSQTTLLPWRSSTSVL